MKKWNFRKPLLTALIIGGSFSLPLSLNAYYPYECESAENALPPPMCQDPYYPVNNCYPYSNEYSEGNEYPQENGYLCEDHYPSTNEYPSPIGKGYPYVNEFPCENGHHYPNEYAFPNEYQSAADDGCEMVFDECPYQESESYPICESRPLEYKTYPLENDFCFPRQSCYCVEFGGEFIYWKPILDDLDYAFVSDAPFIDLTNNEATGTGKFKYAHFDWEPGFRLYVKSFMLLAGWNVSSSYTYIHPHTKNSTEILDLEESLMLATATHGGFSEIDDLDTASARWNLKYKDFDFLFSFDFQNQDGHVITPFIGVGILRLDHNVDINYYSTISLGFEDVEWDGDFFGAGLKAGACYRFDLAKNFYLDAKASASILNGNADYSYRVVKHSNIVDPDTTNIRIDSNESIFVPGFQIAINMGYNGKMCNLPLKLEIGYEFVEWDNTPNPKKFWEDSVLLGIGGPSSLATLGFHGFKAGLTVSF